MRNDELLVDSSGRPLTSGAGQAAASELLQSSQGACCSDVLAAAVCELLLVS